jgi:hypothetical protein
VLTLDDVLLEDGKIAAFSTTETTYGHGRCGGDHVRLPNASRGGQ